MPQFDFDAARETMVESQIRTADVTDLSLLASFRRTARERFVPSARMALAYGDAIVDYDDGRALLRPRDFAKLAQAANIQSDEVVLDIACARGYSTAVLAQVAETVVGLETDDETVDRATALLTDAGVLNAAVVKGDLKRGASEHGPFDVIMVGGAVAEVPQAWFGQLTNGGRLAVIIKNGPIGHATIFTKSGDAIGDRVVFDANAPYLPGFEPARSFVF
ncbi:protein-L-isoaspartate O-methyltransferase [Algimonas ampicilliniresistens]|uniref:Protein-L-isoaspartate O-methyltransferase n=1 Tax=Algimonas ampicilliniresistens TaxID=1298735 RepID=A0ABQ5V7R2_9PROT|nr:protein-L-isoaspartate O-methyltransferase [Algimonas ampicilliniresistens]GLQ22898.1 protein-L-isoaspartate O-methyltransferase [Algimonas ampicilliniresistens]